MRVGVAAAAAAGNRGGSYLMHLTATLGPPPTGVASLTTLNAPLPSWEPMV